MTEAGDLVERRTGARAGDTRARILDAAIDLFMQRGVEKTSLREIAEQLGITKAALYYHFPSKEALVRSLIDPFLEEIEALLTDTEARGDVPPREFLEAYFDLFVRHGNFLRLLIQDLSAFANLGLVEQFLGWQVRVRYLVVGPDASHADQIRAVLALGGLQDCAAILPEGIDVEEARPIALAAALAALGMQEPQPSNR
jgi:AcrR family transcriptional regulator